MDEELFKVIGIILGNVILFSAILVGCALHSSKEPLFIDHQVSQETSWRP